MTDKLNIIKDNVQLITGSYRVQNDLLKGEIEEVAALYRGKLLNYNEAAYIFKDIFDVPMISNEYMFFCKALSDNCCFIDSVSRKSYGINTVSLMDNLYSKDAFHQFNKILALAAEYENSFTSLCEAVYSGRSNYAVLPLFNTMDGLITSVYKLIQRYDLKIIASTKILVGNGETETEFVLVTHQKSNFIFSERLMISVTHDYGKDIIELLSAFKSVNVPLNTINTLPLSYTDDRCESLLTFDMSACDSKAICCFLKTALPQANIIGLYSIC